MKLQNASDSHYIEGTITFLRFAAKHYPIAQLFGRSYQPYVPHKLWKNSAKENLKYLQNKTSRLYHIRRRCKKCKNKNVLDVLKSSKYISLFERWLTRLVDRICFEDFKTSRTFLFLHFTFLIRASNVVKTWCLILQVLQVIRTHS